MDVIIEVRDARLPFSSRNPLLHDVCSNKKCRLVVFNKSDLGNSNMRGRISDKLKQQESLDSIFISATKKNKISKLINWCNMNSKAQFQQTGGIYHTFEWI